MGEDEGVVCVSYLVKQAVPSAGPGQTEGGRGGVTEVDVQLWSKQNGSKERMEVKTVPSSPVGETGCQRGRKTHRFHSKSCQMSTRRGNKRRKSLPV